MFGLNQNKAWKCTEIVNQGQRIKLDKYIKYFLSFLSDITITVCFLKSSCKTFELAFQLKSVENGQLDLIFNETNRWYHNR